jgi:hypothetical protein
VFLDMSMGTIMVLDMFDRTKIVGKFREKPLMYSLLFFLPNILVKGSQTWKLS